MNLDEIVKKNSQELHIPPETYSKIITISFPQSEQDINELESAIKNTDYDVIKSMAHRLKGVYANLRITEISVPAEEIDELAKVKGDIEKIKDFFNQLNKKFKEVQEMFE